MLDVNCNYRQRQLNTRVDAMCVWLAFGLVVLESFPPLLYGKVPSDAGSRLLSKAFSVRRVLVELFISRA